MTSVTIVAEQILYRPVPGYDDLYAGIDGSFVHGEKGLLKQTLRKDGYLIVRIPMIKQTLSHRLMAAAFLGPCPEGLEVRHGDRVRSNNALGNLCYGSTADNAQDAMRDGTHQGAIMRAKTKCSEGHDYSPENTYLHPTTGSRHCRTCRANYAREYARTHPRNRAKRAAARTTEGD